MAIEGVSRAVDGVWEGHEREVLAEGTILYSDSREMKIMVNIEDENLSFLDLVKCKPIIVKYNNMIAMERLGLLHRDILPELASSALYKRIIDVCERRQTVLEQPPRQDVIQGMLLPNRTPSFDRLNQP